MLQMALESVTSLVINRTNSLTQKKMSQGITTFTVHTTRSVAWLLQQDPPPDVNIRDSDQETPLMLAACAGEDPEGKVRILLEHGADRDRTTGIGRTALYYARLICNKPAAIDLLENYRPDVSR